MRENEQGFLFNKKGGRIFSLLSGPKNLMSLVTFWKPSGPQGCGGQRLTFPQASEFIYVAIFKEP